MKLKHEERKEEKSYALSMIRALSVLCFPYNCIQTYHDESTYTSRVECQRFWNLSTSASERNFLPYLIIRFQQFIGQKLSKHSNTKINK